MNAASDVRAYLVLFLVLALLWSLSRAAGKLAPTAALAPLAFLLSRKAVLVAWAVGAAGMLALLVPGALAKGHDSVRDFIMMGALGVFCGLGFAVLVVGPTFMAVRAFAPAPTFSLADGEEVLHERAANHFLRGEARGGKLIVTTKRVGFLSHRFNVQLDDWSVGFDDIADIHREGDRFLVMKTAASKQPEWIVCESPDALATYIRELKTHAEPERAGSNGEALRSAGLAS